MNTTAFGATPENTLTAEKLRNMMAQLPKMESDYNPLLLAPFGVRRIYEAPPPPPKIQVSDIRLRDGTPLLPAEFRARINAELVARFGYQDDIFKDRIYLLGNYGMVMSRAHHAIVNMAFP